MTRRLLAVALLAGAAFAAAPATACELSQCGPTTAAVCQAIGGCTIHRCYYTPEGRICT